MVDLIAQQKKKMNPFPVSSVTPVSKNNLLNEARSFSTEHCQNQKRSLTQSTDSVLASTRSGDGNSKDKLELITATMPLSKKQRMNSSRTKDVNKHEQISIHDADENSMVGRSAGFGLQDNTRIEVKWELMKETCNILEMETRWWGAKLLPHDGRMHILSKLNESGDDPVTVPLRVLDYDTYAEGGFHEISRAEVTFLNNHFLYDVAERTYLRFRMKDSSWDGDKDPDEDDDTVISASGYSPREEKQRAMIETILQSVVTAFGCSGEMEGLSAAQQCFVEAKICLAKESLIEKMIKRIAEEDGGVITADCAKQYMQEMENELHSW